MADLRSAPADVRLVDQLNLRHSRKAVAVVTPQEKSERFVLKVMVISFALGVMTMKVALPLDPGRIALQIALIIQFATLAILAFAGRLKISLPKLLFFMLFALACLVTAMLQPNPNFSLPSLGYVLAIYASYVFLAPVRDDTLRKYLEWIQIMGLVAVGIVILQWMFQFTGMEMPNIEHIIPKPLVFFNYVYIQPLTWGHHFMKPNGYFFLETSYVSQFIAFALVMEAALFQRFKNLVAYAVGLVLTFGGTGFTLVLLCAPVLLFYFRLKMLPLLLIALPVTAITAIQIGLVDNVENRLDEFGEEGSSGNQRFNAQFERVGEVLRGPTREILIGIGSGQMPQRLHIMWTPVSKVIVEYGLISYGFFWLFLLYAMFGRGIPFIVSWMALMQYLFLNGSFLVPMNSFYNVMFAALLMVRPGDQTHQLRRVFARSPRG